MTSTLAKLLGLLAVFWPIVNAQTPLNPAAHVLNARQQAGSYTTWGVVLKFPFKTYIDSWSFSVTVPPVPTPQADQGYSVVGLETNSVQYFISLASYGNPKKIGCNAKPGQWCVIPSYFAGTTQTNGTVAVVSPKDVLVYSFKQESPTSGTLGPGYRIKITRNGQVLSQLRAQNDIGLGIGYVISSGCSQTSQRLPSFQYSNLVYGLGLPYPDFIKDSPPQKDGSSNSKPFTPDNGLTWKIDTVTSNSIQCIA